MATEIVCFGACYKSQF